MTINLFKRAVEKNELLDFALGKGDYFIADKDYGEHWVLGSWLYHILPVIEDADFDVERLVNEMMVELIDDETNPINTKFEVLIYHVHVFYYLKKEKKIEAIDFVSNLDLKIYDVIEKAKQFFMKSGAQSKLETMDRAIKRIQKNGGLVDYSVR